MSPNKNSITPRKFKPEDSKLLIPSRKEKRLKFLINNHRKLIKIMRALTPEQHRQNLWMIKNSNSWCGTSACALGWAVLSGEFKGLGYANQEDYPYFDAENGHIVVAQGFVMGDFCDEFDRAMAELENDDSEYEDFRHISSWNAIAIAWFGNETYDQIFSDGGMSQYEVIENLEARLKELRAELRRPARYREIQ